MESKIRVGIVGYGNLGRGGVELALKQNPDLCLKVSLPEEILHL